MKMAEMQLETVMSLSRVNQEAIVNENRPSGTLKLMIQTAQLVIFRSFTNAIRTTDPPVPLARTPESAHHRTESNKETLPSCLN